MEKSAPNKRDSAHYNRNPYFSRSLVFTSISPCAPSLHLDPLHLYLALCRSCASSARTSVTSTTTPTTSATRSATRASSSASLAASRRGPLSSPAARYACVASTPSARYSSDTVRSIRDQGSGIRDQPRPPSSLISSSMIHRSIIATMIHRSSTTTPHPPPTTTRHPLPSQCTRVRYAHTHTVR